MSWFIDLCSGLNPEQIFKIQYLKDDLLYNLGKQTVITKNNNVLNQR